MEVKDTTEYDFDIQDRLRSIKHNGQLRAEYEYDHRGLRTKNTQYRLDNRPDPFSFFARWDTSAPLSVRSEQYYWYGAGTEVLADTDDKGNVTGIYIMAGGRKIATVASRASATRASSGAETRYYHTDVLGSVTAITDEQGRILEANIYGPFGETEFSYKGGLTKQKYSKQLTQEEREGLIINPELYFSNNRYTYTGQEQDEFGGLMYYNARWYDPEIGRFISEDPAAANPNDPLTINRYIYCRNSPLIYVDPTGEIFGIDDFVFILICAVVAAIGNTIDAMNNPRNEWHGGNYNDAFWHGFKNGAQVGSLIVSISHIVESFCGVAKTADGSDILKNHEALKQKGVGLDGVSFEDYTNMTVIDVKATESGGVYESIFTYQGKTYAGSSLPNFTDTQATIVPGEYRYEVVYSDYYKSNVLVINEGGKVPVFDGFNPNINYPATYGTPYADQILVHYGNSEIWRGSAGCLTIQPDQWSNFISNFKVGATGLIRISR